MIFDGNLIKGMGMDESGIVAWMYERLGGAGTSFIVAITARLMFHRTEALRGKRKFLGKEIWWELPVAIGMAIIAEGIVSWLKLDRTVGVALLAAVSYLGPKLLHQHGATLIARIKG